MSLKTLKPPKLPVAHLTAVTVLFIIKKVSTVFSNGLFITPTNSPWKGLTVFIFAPVIHISGRLVAVNTRYTDDAELQLYLVTEHSQLTSY